MKTAGCDKKTKDPMRVELITPQFLSLCNTCKHAGDCYIAARRSRVPAPTVAECSEYTNERPLTHTAECEARRAYKYLAELVRRLDADKVSDDHEALTFHPLRHEADPSGLDSHAPGAKLDAGKPDMSMLLDFGLALHGVAEVATFGAKKYSRGGWVDVADGVNRYTAAMQRHAFTERYADIDEDSGLEHAKQVAWNALARLELMLRGGK